MLCVCACCGLQVLIDLKEVAAGSLFEDWDMLAPKTIKVSAVCWLWGVCLCLCVLLQCIRLNAPSSC